MGLKNRSPFPKAGVTLLLKGATLTDQLQGSRLIKLLYTKLIYLWGLWTRDPNTHLIPSPLCASASWDPGDSRGPWGGGGGLAHVDRTAATHVRPGNSLSANARQGRSGWPRVVHVPARLGHRLPEATPPYKAKIRFHLSLVVPGTSPDLRKCQAEAIPAVVS